MGRGMEGRRGGERGGALRGLKLSDAEKANVKAVHTKYEQQFKTLRESMKPVFEEARTLRQKGDTAGLRALWLRNGASRDQMQALEARQRTDIRAALSPDNQKQFDANVAEQAKRRAERERTERVARASAANFASAARARSADIGRSLT